MNEELYFKDAFTEVDGSINLEVNNLKANCITSNNNKFSLDSEGNLIVNSITTSTSNDSNIDFDMIISSIPKGILNEKAFNKRVRDLIINLSFVYDLDNLKITELIRSSINEKGAIDKELLRKNARRYYQFNNGTLPTLVYRTQPEYLKTPVGDNSKRGKIIAVFENTRPCDFLRNKNKGVRPSPRELKIIDSLLIDLELTPAVVNVLIDYVLKKNNNKFTEAYVDTIARQWQRENLKTADEAMRFAEKEHKKMMKKAEKRIQTKKVQETPTPVWFDQTLEKEVVSDEEQKELENLLKEFR